MGNSVTDASLPSLVQRYTCSEVAPYKSCGMALMQTEDHHKRMAKGNHTEYGQIQPKETLARLLICLQPLGGNLTGFPSPGSQLRSDCVTGNATRVSFTPHEEDANKGDEPRRGG